MTGTGPLISVVVPHIDQPDALEACLDSLKDQSLARCFFEIIVVDNGSTSDPEPIVARYSGIRLLREPQPGRGPARNHGARHATGDIIAFIDADCRAHHDWLLNALWAIDSAAPGTILGGDVRIWRDCANAFTAIEAYEEVFGYRFKMLVERHGYSGAGNMVVRRSDYEKTGPFGGIGIAEDIEWGRRARSAGLKFRYIPEMLVLQPVRRSLQELCVKWEVHTQHDFTVIRGTPGWKLRWISRALAVLTSPAIDSVRILASNRIQSTTTRLKAIGVLFAIRISQARKMLALLDASNPVMRNRDVVQAARLGPEPAEESGKA